MPPKRSKTFQFSNQFQDTIKRCITNSFSCRDLCQSIRSFTHVPENIAYEQMVNELSNIEPRFYDHINGRILKNLSSSKDLAKFAVPNIIEMLNILYNVRYSYVSCDYESRYDESSNSDDDTRKHVSVTPGIAKKAMNYAHLIWKTWTLERINGPRGGVILISNITSGAEKVLLISWLDGNYCNLGLPKGKFNHNEAIREGCLREFIEETGLDCQNEILYVALGNGQIIRKYPHMGYRSRCQFCTHYYVIAMISDECGSFRVDKNEVYTAEWHSIYSLPCGKNCKIAPKFISINGSELKINYHMVILPDINGQNSTVLDILAYIDAMNGNRSAYEKYQYFHRRCTNKSM